MSLIHWWPLNGNTNNYGTMGHEVQATSSDVTFINGKIGQALYKGSLILTGEQWKKIIGNTISIAMWVYTRDDGSYSAGVPFFGNGNMTEPNNRKFAMFHYPNKTTLHCSWQNDDQSSGENPSTYWGCTYSNFFTIGEWVHLCIVQNAATNTITVYRNGEQYSKSTVNVGNLASMNFKEAGAAPIRANIDYQHTNDLRIYDHALSAAEVKELSKALVVHYTFDDVLAEPTTNIIAGIQSAYGSASLETGRVKINWSPSGGDSYFMFNCIQTIKANSVYTLSFDCEGLKSGEVATFAISNLDAAIYNIELKNGRNSLTFTAGSDLMNDINTYNRLFFDDRIRTDGAVFYLSNFQLEERDHATPYTPTNREAMICNEAGYNHSVVSYNTQLVTDNSVGSLSCHTPRILSTNNTGTITPDNASYLLADVFGYPYTPTEFSLSWWWKPIDWGYGTGPFGLVIGSTDYQNSTLGVHDSYARINFTDGTSQKSFNFTQCPLNEWSHFVITYKPGEAVSYINGNQQTKHTPDTTLTLDSWRYLYLGACSAGGVVRDGDIYWSDIRYYASCLSPEEIKDLYNCGGRISNLGDAFTGEFIEDAANAKINKNHTIQMNEFIENDEGKASIKKGNILSSRQIIEI